MSEHHGSCHCGRIHLVLRDAPSEASECDCSICRRHAGIWHYCSPERAAMTGEAVAYRQGDCALDLWHCPTCACVTHWTPTDRAYPRIGVKLRMFDPKLWRDLPHRLVNGASY